MHFEGYLEEHLDDGRFGEIAGRLRKRRKSSSPYGPSIDDLGLESNGDVEITCTDSSTSLQSLGVVSPETKPRKNEDMTYTPLIVRSDSHVEEHLVVSLTSPNTIMSVITY